MQMPQSFSHLSVQGGMLLLHSYHTATAGWCTVPCHSPAIYAFSALGLDLLRLQIEVWQRKRDPEVCCTNMKQQRMESQECIKVVLVSGSWEVGRYGSLFFKAELPN